MTPNANTAALLSGGSFWSHLFVSASKQTAGDYSIEITSVWIKAQHVVNFFIAWCHTLWYRR